MICHHDLYCMDILLLFLLSFAHHNEWNARHLQLRRLLLKPLLIIVPFWVHFDVNVVDFKDYSLATSVGEVFFVTPLG